MEKTFLDFDQALALLQVSEGQLYKLTRLRMIPHYKPTGRKIYFIKQELETWIMQSAVKVAPSREDLNIMATTHVVLNPMK